MVVNMVAICLEKLGHSNFESPSYKSEVQILGFNPARERSGREEGEVRAGHAFHSTSLQEVPIHYNGAYFRIDMHRIMPCPQGSVPVLSWFDAVFCCPGFVEGKPGCEGSARVPEMVPQMVGQVWKLKQMCPIFPRPIPTHPLTVCCIASILLS